MNNGDTGKALAEVTHKISIEFDQQQPLGSNTPIQQGFGENTGAGAKFENRPLQRKINLTSNGFAKNRAGGKNGAGIARTAAQVLEER
jgi:hypothetical protein